MYIPRTSQVALMVKNSPANAGDIRDTGLIPGFGGSPGGGHSNPLQYSRLENAMDRGAWWAMAHGVAKNQTQLKQFSMQAYIPHLPKPVICCWALGFFPCLGY